MNKKLIENIKTAFHAPEPTRKNEFLQTVNYPKATRLDFVISQIGYIRKRVWIVTLLATVPALVALYLRITENLLSYVWAASSLFPFIALAGITEIARSMSYNMAELEVSCKNRFHDVMLARLSILGFADMVIFIIIIVLFRMTGVAPVLHLAIYLFVPFLLTCSLSLFALNRLRSRESVYACGVVSCFVSIMNVIFVNQYHFVFADRYVMVWVGGSLILLVWTAREMNKLVRRTEEFAWNSSLTA